MVTETHEFVKPFLYGVIITANRCKACGKKKNTIAHIGFDPTLDEDGYPAKWSDPTYLGDGPWGA